MDDGIYFHHVTALVRGRVAGERSAVHDCGGGVGHGEVGGVLAPSLEPIFLSIPQLLAVHHGGRFRCLRQLGSSS